MAESEFTIKDIARLANVSPSTVSRYINGHFERMSPKTARLIAEIIAEHHFVPNKSAQKLKHQKSNLIGVMVANIDDSFSTELYKGAEGILKAGGYDAMLLQSNGEIQREQELIDDLHELQIDGLLLQPLQSEVAAFNELKESKMPVVFLDRFLEGRPWQDVESNNSAISAELARLIVRQQYEQVLIVSEPVGTISTRVQRVEGITSVLDEHHVAFKVLEIEQKSLNRGQIYQRIAELTNNYTIKTAVIALKEQLLLQLIAGAYQLNINYPEQIGLAGYADTKIINILAPELTVISQKPYEMGQIGAELLLNKLKSKDDPERVYVIPAELKIGKSL